jgi:anti-sigma factor RsiW
MEPTVKLSCDNARSLVPSYLDGELSEAQASPLRAHLLDCPACREVAKEGKALQRWFGHPESPPAIPAGFAARVARRAFAGDPGLLAPEPREVRRRRPLLPFLVAATAVAAAILLVLAFAIQRESLPRANHLEALQEDRPPWLDAPAAPEDRTR